MAGKYGFAQSIPNELPGRENWRPVGSSRSIDHRVVPELEKVVRPADSNQSTGRANPDYLKQKANEAVGQDLLPQQLEAVESAIDNYDRNQVTPTVVGHEDVPSDSTPIIIRSNLQSESLKSAPTQLLQEVFESEVFMKGTAEKKWELLKDAATNWMLSSANSIPEGENGVSIDNPVSLAEALRHATPTQLGHFFDLDALPKPIWPDKVTLKQVAPGMPIPEINFGNEPCADQWCGSPSPRSIPIVQDDGEENANEGRAVITYRENAYEQVVVLQPGRISFNREHKRCTATLIDSVWALSALHCFGESGSSLRSGFHIKQVKGKNWLELTPTKDSVYAISLKRNDIVSAHLVEKAFVPYIDEFDIRYKSGTVPLKDIALIRIKGAEMTKFAAYPEFASEKSIVPKAAVTFVGYGWTDITGYNWLKSKQAAFNWLTDSREGVIQWKTGNWGGNGGPCLGDSGGPIFLGFLRGHIGHKERIAGIVSELPADQINEGSQCLSKTGQGEPLSPYISDICEITSNTPTGC